MIDSVKGVYISTYGCQMNVNDSERMYSMLEMSNYNEVKAPEEADLIIINSCSIREKPVHKVHSELGRYVKLKRKNARLKLAVGGCVGQQEKAQLLKDIPYLDFVFGPDNIDTLPSMIAELEEKQTRVSKAKFEHQKPYEIITMVRNPGVATFMNITKGCDNFCTFCVVPFTRGRLRSRPLTELVKDVNDLVSRGVKEVTLLGQNVNSYESDCGANFSKLLKTLSEDTDIKRIRYVTSHPKDFNQELIETLAKYREKLCDYIHLPVQAGSTEVLRRMNRVYSREDYLDKIKMIKEYIPGVSLSSDFICGFPGETDQDFEDTMSLIHEVEFETIYAFTYSPRPFTKAAKYTDQVPEDVKDARLARLLSEQRLLAFDLAKRYEGKVLEVLVESLDKKGSKEESGSARVMGRSTQNKLVHFDGPADLVGKIVPVKIIEAAPVNFNGVLQV
jgi:tRNA-2-methylthio-N6-dimethylallyladenosine synthase